MTVDEFKALRSAGVRYEDMWVHTENGMYFDGRGLGYYLRDHVFQYAHVTAYENRFSDDDLPF